MSDSLLHGLTTAQCEAVQHIDGPLLILAGPGSGKTRVITHRIAHLLEQQISASEIVALTFTNKAADEMRARVERLVPGAEVWLGTFHRFCARLLRRYASLIGLPENYSIYDTTDSQRALKRAIIAVDADASLHTPAQIADAISWAKNNLISAEDYQPRPGHPLGQVVAEVYPKYQATLLSSAAADFDDLLLHVVKLLQQNPEIREELDARFRYILVDEYQDTNIVQFAIVRALSVDHPNLAVTGDPDQSIFSWRGANLTNILQFESSFPQVKTVRLERNYRSTQRILRVADTLIRYNVQRKEKRLFTENAEGPPVRLVTFATQRDEAESIVMQIADEVGSGRRRPRDFAIFYRTNALSRSFEQALNEAAIPFQLVKAVEFFGRKEVKDVVAYLQLINNPRDDVACQRIINTPPRGIGNTTQRRLVEYADNSGIPLLEAARQSGLIESLSSRAAVRLARFAAMIDGLALSATGLLEEIVGLVLTESGYLEHFEQSESREDQERLANVQELQIAAREFDERHPEQESLELFLQETALVNDTDAWEEESDRVTLMTLHSAKGLEFPVVFLTAVEENILPHERSRQDAAGLEEERRLMFVGITRAQELLQISLAARRGFRGNRRLAVPSSFLSELPRDEMELINLSGHRRAGDPYDKTSEVDAEVDESYDEPVYRHVDPEDAVADSIPGLTTAAQLGKTASAGVVAPTSKANQDLDTEAFYVGMAVQHPDHGLGKIAALSGRGSRRTATVNFVTAGQRQYVLGQSALRPAGG